MRNIVLQMNTMYGMDVKCLYDWMVYVWWCYEAWNYMEIVAMPMWTR